MTKLPHFSSCLCVVNTYIEEWMVVTSDVFWGACVSAQFRINIAVNKYIRNAFQGKVFCVQTVGIEDVLTLLCSDTWTWHFTSRRCTLEWLIQSTGLLWRCMVSNFVWCNCILTQMNTWAFFKDVQKPCNRMCFKPQFTDEFFQWITALKFHFTLTLWEEFKLNRLNWSSYVVEYRKM